MRYLSLTTLLVFGVNFYSCTQNNMETHYNHLNNETSPYLLQHVHNPVNWYPWGEEALEKAKKENKLIIISIGYSACHWCHVMEKESFEDEEVAKIMNENFVSIKIDREERPDIDQIYMNAVHLMKQRGGWPLNCITLPTGEPIWGGTYFRKNDWIKQIKKVNEVFQQNPKIVQDYAQKITKGIQTSELPEFNTDTAIFNTEILKKYYSNWSKRFDHKHGGKIGSPKFPLPNNYQFLIDYGIITNNEDILEYVKLSLDNISNGGIYDQIGGGFCRYATDEQWKVPHFEKMLYDNAQLISLFSSAYLVFQDNRYKTIINNTLGFIERELYHNESGAFFSSLDADSEGEEGRFYVWEEQEIKNILKQDFNLCKDYYNINKNGLWDGKYILLKKEPDSVIAKKYNLTSAQLSNKVNEINQQLFNSRTERTRPGLDDKSLTSWNGLMLKAYTDAYKALQKSHYLDIAIRNGEFILKYQKRKDGGLFHNYKNKKSSINGFLEDYAFVIEAFIGLYEVTLNENWLNEATQLMDYTFDNFFDKKSGMFFFTSKTDNPLIARKFEIQDNVIPASNSTIGKCLFKLGHILSNKYYLETASQMANNIKNDIASYGPGYSNWATLITYHTYPFYEIAIVGKEYKQTISQFQIYHLPNTIVIGTEKNSNLNILKNKFTKGHTYIYVCENGACQQPQMDIDKAISQIKY
jgi:uncharacterized protein YyaL (SSP411 family)